MEIIFLIAGLLIGALLGYFISNSRQSSNLSRLSEKEMIISDKEKQLSEANAVTEEERRKVIGLTSELAATKERYFGLEEKLKDQKNEIEDLQKKFTDQFEVIASKILEDKSRRFTEQNKENLDLILNPFKEKIDNFKDKVERVYKSESDERNILKGEINKLIDLNRQISEEAENLTKALKGDIKKQGNWGEFVLERVLERSGLVKDREYKMQVSAIDTDGKRTQPDVVVYLPENKHIIIDSKVSLVAYDKFVNSENEDEKALYLKEHLSSLKNHIKGLSDKNYQTTSNFNSPDFVLLFIPIESSFSLIVEADTEIFNYAWDRKIQIVTPSTLLISLMTIASLWQREKQNRYALEIAEVGGSMYDKFESLIKDLIEVGNRIKQSQDCYESAMKKLHIGPGNLVKQVEKMKKLGANAKKSLPPQLVERSEENDIDNSLLPQ
ncbi:MAG: DNA recombination protein RmuC [Ignavibacteria bacterium]|nr:DNA recombination protein RmuC [Ignavibacteria bacterium]